MWTCCFYFQFYVSFKFLEMLFDLDESNVCRHIQQLEPMLADVIKIRKYRDLSQSELETIICYWSEDAEIKEKSKEILFWKAKTSHDKI